MFVELQCEYRQCQTVEFFLNYGLVVELDKNITTEQNIGGIWTQALMLYQIGHRTFYASCNSNIHIMHWRAPLVMSN